MKLNQEFLDKTHVMVDIETMGTGVNSVILQVSFEAFNFLLDGREITELDFSTTIYPCLSEQVESGRSVDSDTVKWWISKNPEFFTILLKKCSNPSYYDSVEEVSEIFSSFNDSGYVMWARSPEFDIQMLENLTGVKYNYRNKMDVRTIEKLFGGRPKAAHDAELDCRFQIEYVKSKIEALR
jgi:hypothetical protein